MLSMLFIQNPDFITHPSDFDNVFLNLELRKIQTVQGEGLSRKRRQNTQA